MIDESHLGKLFKIKKLVYLLNPSTNWYVYNSKEGAMRAETNGYGTAKEEFPPNYISLTENDIFSPLEFDKYYLKIYCVTKDQAYYVWKSHTFYNGFTSTFIEIEEDE